MQLWHLPKLASRVEKYDLFFSALIIPHLNIFFNFLHFDVIKSLFFCTYIADLENFAYKNPRKEGHDIYMKRLILTLVAGAVLTAVGNTKELSEPPLQTHSDTSAADETASLAPEDLQSILPNPDNNTISATDKIYVMDTYMKTGIVSELEQLEDGTARWVLTSANGTSDVLNVFTDNDTRTNFNLWGLKDGMTVEVYYESPDDEVRALAVNYITSAQAKEFRVFEGSFVETRKNGANEGMLTVESADGRRYVFTYGQNTAIEVDLDSLKPGDQLYIEHSMIETRSLPPQSPAYLIRKVS